MINKGPLQPSLLSELEHLSKEQLRRLLSDHLTRRKLGLYWESDAIARDAALNANLVFPRRVEAWSHCPTPETPCPNLVIEGDNFDALRLLGATHRGRIRVIYIDPPYNTGNKDWVYNDHYVGPNDRWRHSQWLEFLFRRLSLARDLLAPDGVILVSINDENRARLELLMDEVFPGRRLGSIAWRTRQGSNADQQCFLSVDHEHVLAYGNPGFSFNGFAKSYEMYGNPDKDPRGDWRTSDLTLGYSWKERPNLYYPLLDPASGVSYPPNPDRVWVYASQERLKRGQTVQAKTMEEFIELGQILFPSNDQRVETWPTLDALLAAIDAGDVPKSGRTPLLRRDLPDLEFWVGRPVGFGRPQFKRYKADLRNQTQPLSSWLVPRFEDGDYEADNSFITGTNQEGARIVAEIFGDRAFNYAKPLSLIKGLLKQATRPGDIVLDFFAGSGTTAQAVLELNAEDGGNRRFILCSSTEATEKTPDKNLCRDITAERVRRVMQGYGGKEGLGGSFAYLQLDLIEPADLAFEASPEHAMQLLGLRELHAAIPPGHGPVRQIAGDARLAVLACFDVDENAIDTLAAWSAERLAVYSFRPDTVRHLLEQRGITVNSYSLNDALRRGQVTSQNQ
ncbi:site-specific DNA-methyltransferase [Zoogloea sp.]|uniref:site-specific DNA-methyltransferase n=1 Tax=Zoogloea sp. TaxID=49181 RepID=UPI0026378520|nr:site-specific DNA-methyltransferase [Zoogloea sp.]